MKDKKVTISENHYKYLLEIEKKYADMVRESITRFDSPESLFVDLNKDDDSVDIDSVDLSNDKDFNAIDKSMLIIFMQTVARVSKDLIEFEDKIFKKDIIVFASIIILFLIIFAMIIF